MIFVLLISLFIISCTLEQPQDQINDEDDKDTTDISDVGNMDEELGTKSLENLEEDLEYIEEVLS